MVRITDLCLGQGHRGTPRDGANSGHTQRAPFDGIQDALGCGQDGLRNDEDHVLDGATNDAEPTLDFTAHALKPVCGDGRRHAFGSSSSS